MDKQFIKRQINGGTAGAEAKGLGFCGTVRFQYLYVKLFVYR